MLDRKFDLAAAMQAAGPIPLAPPAEPGFAIRGLGKRFGDKTVLEGIDLDVPAGQFVAVIGKSGCGKSTLLRLLAGLDRPDEGEIRIGAQAAPRRGAPAQPGNQPGPRPGTRPGMRPGVRPDVRIVFQEPRLLPWARVVDNVAVGLTGVARRDRARERAQAILAAVGLEDRGGDWPSVLSGGQRQRVALARALIGGPSILAFDEPLGALDALTRIEMQALLERVWRDQGFTAVLVTHDVAEAVVLADRVVVLDGGRASLDLPIDLPRPRRHGGVAEARLEARILEALFAGDPAPGARRPPRGTPPAGRAVLGAGS